MVDQNLAPIFDLREGIPPRLDRDEQLKFRTLGLRGNLHEAHNISVGGFQPQDGSITDHVYRVQAVPCIVVSSELGKLSSSGR